MASTPGAMSASLPHVPFDHATSAADTRLIAGRSDYCDYAIGGLVVGVIDRHRSRHRPRIDRPRSDVLDLYVLRNRSLTIQPPPVSFEYERILTHDVCGDVYQWISSSTSTVTEHSFKDVSSVPAGIPSALRDVGTVPGDQPEACRNEGGQCEHCHQSDWPSANPFSNLFSHLLMILLVAGSEHDGPIPAGTSSQFCFSFHTRASQ